MKRSLTRIVIVCLVFSIICAMSTDDADAGVVAGIATEWTQIMNNIQLVLSYEQMLQDAVTQVQQYETQIQQFETQTQHLEQAYKQTDAMVNGLSNFNFSAIANDLRTINSAVQYGNSMAYTMANLDDEFNDRFPGYGGTTGASYPQQYRKWFNTNLDTAHAALRVTGLQYSQLQNDADLTQTLQQQSANSTTLLQTLQVANTIGTQEIAELQKLRQLIMTDVQSKATFQAQQSAAAQADDDLDSTFFAMPDSVNTDTRTFAPVPYEK